MERMRRLTLVCAALFALAAGMAFGAGRVAPTHEEGKTIAASGPTKAQGLTTFCLGPDGNLLACDSGARSIKVITPNDELKNEWKLDFAPEAICMQGRAIIFVGGAGRLAKLDLTGRILKSISTRDAAIAGTTITGMAATNTDVFVACRAQTGYAVYRLDNDLGQSRLIVDRLSGCCGQMDIAAWGGDLYVAENGRHRVLRCDRNGKVLATWGKGSRTDLEGFGSCCNPMNICFDSKGRIYTSEARLGRVKCYTRDGKFIGLVGEMKAPPSCVRVTVDMSADGRQVFLLDTQNNKIQVIERR